MTLAKSWARASRDRVDRTEIFDCIRYQILHPAASVPNEDVHWPVVERMVRAAVAAGVRPESNPFTADEWEQNRLWLEFYETTKEKTAG